jgi:gamma-glutamylcyclotransferase (GGCT)/AIG2-like uncharacterized protein YtfP
MLYFAYGINTNQSEMSYRCPDARSLGGAELPDHEFRFAVHADIVESPGSRVRGVLWDITERCLQALDRLEGYPTYYERKTVTVSHNGKQLEAMTYYMTGNQPDMEPGHDYLFMLYKGYAYHDISARQITDAIDYINSYQSAVGTKGSYYYDYQ